MDGITMVVTPEMAASWLATSPGNRRLRPWWVTRLATTMREGRWMLTHQGVAMDEEGRLLDGHHRLEAVIQSDSPQTMFVVRGCHRATFEALDHGLKRTFGDLLGIDERLAHPLRLAAQWYWARGTPAAYEVALIAETGLGEAIQELIDACGNSRKVVSAAPVKLAAGLLMLEGRDGIPDAYRRLVTLSLESMTTAEQALTKQVMDGKATALKTADLLARALRALDPLRGSTQRIQISAGDDLAAVNWVRETLRRRMAP